MTHDFFADLLANFTKCIIVKGKKEIHLSMKKKHILISGVNIFFHFSTYEWFLFRRNVLL